MDVTQPSSAPASVYCHRCGFLVQDPLRFCPRCGAELYFPSLTPTPAREGIPWGYADIAMAIGLVIAAAIVLSIPVILVALALGLDIESGRGEAAVMIIGGMLTQGALLFAVAWFSVRKYGLSWAALGLTAPQRGGWWLPVPVFFTAVLIITVNAAVIDVAGIDVEGNVPSAAFDALGLIVLLAVVSLAVAPPVEELFFRGFIFGGLKGRLGFPAAAVVSGLLFALAHFTGLGTVPILPAFALIGALFAWAYHYTGSLYAPIGAHLFFNLLMLVLGTLRVAD